MLGVFDELQSTFKRVFYDRTDLFPAVVPDWAVNAPACFEQMR